MIEGESEPPGVFLNASAVLERQFTAYCMDRWVESGIGDNALPLQLRYVLGNIGSDDPKKFPYIFLNFIELLYVSATRAKKEAQVSCFGKPSEYLEQYLGEVKVNSK
ncbi:MAG: hypothetical protein GY850_36795 [bacterium]|nr:hypothetical protein [bacterium]